MALGATKRAAAGEFLRRRRRTLNQRSIVGTAGIEKRWSVATLHRVAETGTTATRLRHAAGAAGNSEKQVHVLVKLYEEVLPGTHHRFSA